jgi:hypothetical protein
MIESVNHSRPKPQVIRRLVEMQAFARSCDLNADRIRVQNPLLVADKGQFLSSC